MPRRPKDGPPPGERPSQESSVPSLPDTQRPEVLELVVDFKERGRVGTSEEQKDEFEEKKRQMEESGREFTDIEEIDLSILPDGALVFVMGYYPLNIYILQKIGETVRVYKSYSRNFFVVSLGDINRSMVSYGRRKEVVRYLKKEGGIAMPYFAYEKDERGNATILKDSTETWIDTIRMIRILLPESDEGNAGK